MKQISILKQGVVTNRGFFDTEEKAMEWLNSCLAKNKFGLPERPELDEAGKETGRTLPAEFTVKIEDWSPSYSAQRIARYVKEIDPYLNEAVMENMQGRPAKLQALLAKREEIRASIPKPTSGVNDNGEQ